MALTSLMGMTVFGLHSSSCSRGSKRPHEYELSDSSQDVDHWLFQLISMFGMFNRISINEVDRDSDRKCLLEADLLEDVTLTLSEIPPYKKCRIMVTNVSRPDNTPNIIEVDPVITEPTEERKQQTTEKENQLTTHIPTPSKAPTKLPSKIYFPLRRKTLRETCDTAILNSKRNRRKDILPICVNSVHKSIIHHNEVFTCLRRLRWNFGGLENCVSYLSTQRISDIGEIASLICSFGKVNVYQDHWRERRTLYSSKIVWDGALVRYVSIESSKNAVRALGFPGGPVVAVSTEDQLHTLACTEAAVLEESDLGRSYSDTVILISRLRKTVSSSKIEKVLSKYGRVLSVHWAKQHEVHVAFRYVLEAYAAFLALNGKHIFGSMIKVEIMANEIDTRILEKHYFKCRQIT